VASNATSIPEVVGDAGTLCDPRDADGFAAALERVVRDPTHAAGMRARGLARAAEFTWERTAAELVAVLDRVLGRAA
jgi:alpha-1,3-rhamnosyl/mannosyltransferase